MFESQVVDQVVLTPGSEEKHVLKGRVSVEGVDLQKYPNPLPDVGSVVAFTTVNKTILVHPTHETAVIPAGVDCVAKLQVEADPLGDGLMQAWD